MHDQHEFNRALITEFRVNAGKLSGQLAHSSILLLTTLGAKSGQERLTPLGYVKDGERLAVLAANAGAATHPDWYYNLTANSLVTIELGSERFPARASIAQGAERERLAAMISWYAAQQTKTNRVISIVLFERTTAE